MSKAFIVRKRSLLVDRAQPTTNLENRSITTARNSFLPPAISSVVSPAQRWLGAEAVKSRLSKLGATGKAGLDEMNCRYVELLYADIHSPLVQQFLSVGNDKVELIHRGSGSRMLTNILLYGVLWCGGFVKSILIQESTQIRTFQTLNLLSSLQKK